MPVPYDLMLFTFEDMVRFAGEAWGPLGFQAAHKWAEFNRRYFDGALRPVPLVITHTQPFGRRLAFCSFNPDTSGRTITVNVPSCYKQLLADNATLLHEMIRQHLFERGEYAGHDGEPWRRELMRLNRLLTGMEIWAGRSKTMRRDGKVVRANSPHPETGRVSLTQQQIARWPHDREDIRLGSLGSMT
jgi:hypothetical protein